MTQVVPLATRREIARPARRLRPVRPRAATSRQPAVPNAVVATLVFLGAEAMFFAGLISSLLVLRAGSDAWPPPDQPRLPIGVTAVNTLILLASGYTIWLAVRAVRADRTRELIRWLSATALLGVLFLVVQGTEWVRLVHYGLHVTSGTYGGTFYTLIGCHGVHVLAGVALLLFVLRGATAQRYSARAHAAVEVCRLYWVFVVGVWPILYVLVYLV